MIAIADTSYVVAVTVQTDQWHEKCLAIHRQHNLIYLPQTTLAEVAYLIGREGGNLAVWQFLSELPTSKYRLVALDPDDLMRTAEILKQYADARLDFVDATVMAVAERMDISRILTLDQRDFSIVRPRHRDYFELLPQSYSPLT
ncbi:MAG: PIN domain-containing protein [Burkholderiales bacterium]|nr:PIN domain-containing protein [Anaerolineae bacterium]